LINKSSKTITMIKLLALLLVSICVVQSVPLNIHVVPHTHDDVGWLKTPDEYYYGANSSIQDAGVQYIIDTVIMALQANPARKFIYVEMAFFFRWWREQSPATQAIVKGLVTSGQLEFINGGWTMHDEACVHFEDMVDQMTLGHQFLKSTFNIVPKIGWQLDPFGHSSTSAILNVLTGFEALFFARMDYQDFNTREADKGLEMTWNPSASLQNISLLTGMMYGGYCSPGGGFMFEYGDPPIQDDPLLEDFNLVGRAQALMQWSNKQASLMRHNDIMLSWGCDFMYQNAHLMYKNIEKLMTYINNNQATYNARMFYSTPSIYAEAIKTANPTLPTKSDDFMPYADGAHSYWSGYFVSRSTLKGFVRYSSHILHAITSLFSTSQISSASLLTELFTVQQPNGVTTHHDAVSGTEKQHVADDYALNLNIANTNAFDMFNQIYGQMIATKAPPTFTFCPLLNQSICPATLAPSGVIPIVIYNPLSWANTDYVRLPINVSSINVVDSNNNSVPSQIIPGSVTGTMEVIFAATVPALGFTTYFLTLGVSSDATEHSSFLDPAAGIILVNKYLTVNFDSNGNLQSVTVTATGQTVPVQQAYQYYISNPGDKTSNQASGAYIFRPDTQTSYPFSTATPQITVTNGSIVSEVRRYFQPDLSQVIRLYANQNYIEIVDIIGPIDISDGKGKEVITRYTTSFNSQSTWYSDSNGIELIQRKLNYRPTWNFTIEEPVAGNFVPVNAITAINDPTQKLQLTVVVDRSRSSASLTNGELETMLHRRCLVDDGRGVGEPLNETTIMASKEWLVISNTTSAASTYRPLAKKAYHPFFLAFGPSTPYATWKNQYKTDYAPLGITVPPNVHILNFVPLGSAQYILRLHHIYQVGEDAVLSQPVTLDIASLLTGYPIASIQETQLTAVVASTREDAVEIYSDEPIASINIILNPTEIRTFIISTKPAKSLDSPPSSIHIN
jgi:lysosomal alpha-mannosidase